MCTSLETCSYLIIFLYCCTIIYNSTGLIPRRGRGDTNNNNNNNNDDDDDDDDDDNDNRVMIE